MYLSSQQIEVTTGRTLELLAPPPPGKCRPAKPP